MRRGNEYDYEYNIHIEQVSSLTNEVLMVANRHASNLCFNNVSGKKDLSQLH